MAFRFRCSKLWDELDVRADPAVRHCTQCGSDVFLCATDEETIAHAWAGHCIAREAPDSSELPSIVLGRPAVPVEYTPQQEEARRWNRRESAINDSIRNASRSERSCPQCTYPAPLWRKTCRVCGYEMGRAVSESED